MLFVLVLLVAPTIEDGCKEKYLLVVLKRVFEDNIVNFLGSFSYQIANIKSSVAVASEKESYIFHDETSHFHFFAFLCVATIFNHLLNFTVNRTDKLENSISAIVVQIDL